MTIKQFCAETGEKYQTVYRNVKKYRDNSLAGHIRDESGESMLLDDYAVYYLMPREMLLEKLLNKISFLSDSYESTRKTAHHYKAEYEKACKTSGDLTSEKLVLQKELSSMKESRDYNRRLYEAECSQHERTRCDLSQAHTDLENANTTHLQLLLQKQDEINHQQDYNTELLSRCDALKREVSEKQAEIDSLRAMINELPEKIKKKYFPTFVI